MTRVVIDTNGPTITVEAEGELTAIADKALELFRAAAEHYPIQPPKTEAPRHSVGFTQVERADGPHYVSGYDVDLRRPA